jgi:alkylated DNA repair dioxygenase AlkB
MLDLKLFSCNMISGLTYIPDFISEGEQLSIVSTIDQLPWLNDLKRKTQHYGYKYDYTKKTVDKSLYLGDLPSWVAPYAERLVKQNHFKKIPDQVIVNEYKPGQGIGRHVDCVSCFGETVASLSLLSTCAMDLERFSSKESGTVILAPLSLLILTGEARYDWMHSIPARKVDMLGDQELKRSRRISLTFRTVIYNS